MSDFLALNPHPSVLRHLRDLEKKYSGNKSQARAAQDRYLKTIGASSTSNPTFSKAERKKLIKLALQNDIQ